MPRYSADKTFHWKDYEKKKQTTKEAKTKISRQKLSIYISPST